ncbi:MAG TPA: D-alanyl-D-alanine carboxypeptidase/D-alanyl-D-alanine-endopeptidase, partial [Candidatus Brocadiia bacterium]|nr:D-alanyl-D-alanine carboxypeptidase/D-alanyl-D-alanine-endopeptidase [Candidatus Brocadiia bacterium]
MRHPRPSARATTLALLAFALLAGRHAPAQDVAARLRKALQDNLPKAGHTGVCVVDLGTGRQLLGHNENKPLALASNSKLFTTGAALALLGPDYQFRTEIIAAGPIAQGTLDGDLVVRGGGDPNISGRFHNNDPMALLVQWAQAVRAAGVERITGDLLADDSFFDRQWTAPGWPEDQRFFWYGAPVGALSFNDNCVYMIARGGASAGDAPTIELKPAIEGLETAVRCRTASTTRLTFIREGDFTFVALGSIAPRRAVGQYVTVGDPGLYTVLAFARALASQGVTLHGKVRRQTPQDSARQRRVLVTGQSSLRESVAVANKRSQNFYAEQILKTLGAVQSGEGSFASGVRAIGQYLKTIGLDSGEVCLCDGSGLSKENRATPSAVVRFLAAINASPCGDVFRNSLAV